MTQEIFMWVIAIAVLVVFFVNLIVLGLIYTQIRRFITTVQSTRDKINPILDKAQEIASHANDMAADAKPIVAEAQPLVRSIMIKTNNRIDPILSEAQGIMSNARGITGTISNIIADNRPTVQSIMTKTNERVDPILNEVSEIMTNVKSITGKVESIATDAQAVAHNVTTKANNITDMVYDQATEIRTLIQDTVIPTLRQQIEQLDDLVKRTTDKADSATATIENEIIGRAVTTTKDITEMVHSQANELSTLVNDTVLKVRTQVEQLDDLVKRTRGTFDSSITSIERQVTTPVREVNYMGTAIKKGLSVLFNRDKSQ